MWFKHNKVGKEKDFFLGRGGGWFPFSGIAHFTNVQFLFQWRLLQLAWFLIQNKKNSESRSWRATSKQEWCHLIHSCLSLKKPLVTYTILCCLYSPHLSKVTQQFHWPAVKLKEFCLFLMLGDGEDNRPGMRGGHQMVIDVQTGKITTLNPSVKMTQS